MQNSRHSPSLAVYAAVSLAAANLAPMAVNAQDAMTEDCTVAVQVAWPSDFSARASASGPCGATEVSLVVLNYAGEVAWSAAYPTQDLFGFEDIYTLPEMASALAGWIAPAYIASSSSTLPHWPIDADGPPMTEFPFFVDENINRGDYEMTRDFDLTMMCYIQGMESLLCLMSDLEAEELWPIGVQTFPG